MKSVLKMQSFILGMKLSDGNTLILNQYLLDILNEHEDRLLKLLDIIMKQYNKQS